MSNLKKLEEQRADLQAEMEALLDTAKTEERAFTEEEVAKFDEKENQIKAIDETIKREEAVRAMEKKEVIEVKDVEERAEVLEERAFVNYIKRASGLFVEERAGEQNITMGNNGAIIPTTIANRIITEVKEMCPILAKATIYNVKGTLKVPVWGLANTTHDITVAYQEEFTAVTADAGKFTSVDLGGYLAAALTLIGKSVINNGAVDVVNFIIKEMSRKIALFLEGQLLTGTGSSAATGALNSTNTLTGGAATAITYDDLIGLQAKVPTVYQKEACWIMNPETFVAVRKLKDGSQRPLLMDNFAQEFPYMLLGKPVYLSDNMPTLAASAKTVLYGDLSGLSVNMRENISVQILNEVYADRHAVGVVSWFEFDSKVTENQKLAVLVQKAS